MRIAYEAWAPGKEARTIIRIADSICSEYGAQGYDLTLRQLYYQFVARDLLPNRQQSYKRLGDIVNKARLAGLLDWSYIVDRTRNLRSVAHWDDPASVVAAAANSYRLDKWQRQPARVEVWVEKEALAGIVQRAADQHDVAWFSCRGYVSQSELWAAARRHLRYLRAGQRVVVLHLGDHDPSGIDMTRDIRERLERFVLTDYAREVVPHVLVGGAERAYERLMDEIDRRVGLGGEDGDHDPIEVRRIALNYDQVEQYDPPPNPAKLTDSRSSGYVLEHGYESWELDALEPTVLGNLIAEHIESVRDRDLYAEYESQEQREREGLADLSDRYDDVRAYLDEAAP